MIAQKFEYTAPKSLDEALHLLANGAKPLAGGMSLIPMMKLRLAAPEHLVDLGRLKDLNYVREVSDELHIGATTTHYDLESSPLVRQKCPLLAETAAAIGDVQVRNTGTIGGSVAHADPAADYPAALQALEAKFVLKGAKGEHTVSAADFFVDAFTTSLEPGEIIREVIVPIDDARTGTSYEKVAQPASGFAIVGIAARVRQNAGKLNFVRIGVTGLANRAYRASAAEKALEGKAGGLGEIQAAAALLAQGVDANSDLHASAGYRRRLAAVHAERALRKALSRIA
ncbi:MAG TPA: xanthine dehydrogenase family protein subunit M [Candidatus Acidoferrum sp.]|nr:xanthine dehydrogenase family protein subunit M [Candidatus Acidoferrum sp.]